jgi:hypothetical protein
VGSSDKNTRRMSLASEKRSTAFNLANFKSTTVEVLDKLRTNFTNEESTITMVSIQKVWDRHAENELLPFYNYFMKLVDNDDSRFYAIVPIATKIANFERLISLLASTCPNSSLKEVMILFPERHMDAIASIDELETQISNLTL